MDQRRHKSRPTHIGAKPEAKLSKAKRRHNWMRIMALSLLRRGRRPNLFEGFFGVPLASFNSGAVSAAPAEPGCLSASQCTLSSSVSSNLMTPIAAYAKKTRWYASTVDQRLRSIKNVVTQPHVTKPKAVPAVPMSAYHAKMYGRSSGVVKWARVDSSMARKGPISLPLPRNVSKARWGRRLRRGSSGPGRDDSQHGRSEQRPVVGGEGEDDTARRHQHSAQRQDVPAAQSICG